MTKTSNGLRENSFHVVDPAALVSLERPLGVDGCRRDLAALREIREGAESFRGKDLPSSPRTVWGLN